MRPTGKLHIGHLHGALKNWVRLQNQGDECFFFAADFHALTSDFEKTEGIPANIEEMAIDWLSCGVDPARATVFVQSHVKEVPELFLLLGMITSMGWLERNPTYKEMRQETTEKDLSNLGFFSYPVMQAADIAVLGGQGVPVGQDQVPHLELTREIVRRFNHLYGQTLVEPQALLTAFPKINGTDGRKMSKSYGNAIMLSDTEGDVKTKVMGMVTDPKRARRQDPGDPDTCNLYPLHVIHSSPDTVAQVREGCVSAGIGCVDCKRLLLPNLETDLAAIRAKRAGYEARRGDVREILEAGAARARVLAGETLNRVRKAMNLA